MAQARAEDRAAVTNLMTEKLTFPEQVTLYTNRLPAKEVDNKALYTAVKNLQGYFKNVKAEVSTLKRSYHSAGTGIAKNKRDRPETKWRREGQYHHPIWWSTPY